MLALDDRKLLPPGVHDSSMKEVEELFGRFQRSDCRPKLFRKLAEYLKELRKAEVAGSVIVNGSFVMACVDEPADIDLILVLLESWDEAADLKPYQYNLVSKKRVKREYGLDVFVVREKTVDEEKWVKFLSRVNVKWCDIYGWSLESVKGLVRVAV